ncbi:MAG: diaminopimelate epimerase [Eubacteriales bacterium]|nr:diaminopimelate epimerase [Eubacteriales bacterium]
MKFIKMEGAGNDYVYVDCTKQSLENPSQTAVKVSDRHFGIGSDGLILIKTSEVADFFMEMYNLDGSQGKMCGNGIRCVGKFVYDNGLTDKTTVRVETLSGIKTLNLNLGADGKVASVTVDMGAPILIPEQIPVKAEAFAEEISKEKPVISKKIIVKGKEYPVTCVSMGNPHAIVYVSEDFDLKGFKIEDIGPDFEHHEAFPEQVNTEFIQVVDRKNLNMRVWERGSGETLACGTGACASLVATVLNGLCDETAVLHLLGGDLTITWDREKNTVFMEGPATTVFTGEINL